MCGMITYWKHGALSALSGFVKKRHTRHFLQHRNWSHASRQSDAAHTPTQARRPQEKTMTMLHTQTYSQTTSHRKHLFVLKETFWADHTEVGRSVAGVGLLPRPAAGGNVPVDVKRSNGILATALVRLVGRHSGTQNCADRVADEFGSNSSTHYVGVGVHNCV